MTPPNQTEPLKLTVSNFGPIAKAEIDLRPLTVFVGPSNTGKSYLATLIYALHKFFGNYGDKRNLPFSQMSSILHENIKAQHPFDADSLRQLADWIKDVSPPSIIENTWDAHSPPPDFFAVHFPNFIAPMFDSLFNNLSDFSEIIDNEIRRSFGVENPASLIRHGNKRSAQITLRSKHFEYELALKRRKPNGTVIWSSEENPRSIKLPTRLIPDFVEYLVDMSKPSFEDSEEWKKDRTRGSAEYFIGTLASSVLSADIKPLSNAAHYVPADRACMMYTYRIDTTTWIEQPPPVGWDWQKFQPLSGVRADFIQNLVQMGYLLESQADNKGHLGAKLEQQMLKGEIRCKKLEKSHPIFSYQPYDREPDEELSLMNASAMVSELAPIVLYLDYMAHPGDVLIIEEPESHLHPAMQVEFVRQLAAVVHSGIRVMLTTHSEWVLDELANLVRASELPKAQRKGVAGGDFALTPDQLGMWLFEPKQRPKGSVVKEIPFDEEFGGFRSGFDEVAVGTYNDYAKISNWIERSRKRGRSR